MKGAFRLRPVYHYREDRNRAHVQLCWLALLLIWVIETAACNTWRNIRCGWTGCTWSRSPPPTARSPSDLRPPRPAGHPPRP